MRLRSYAVVTAGYWAFTVTDGALRMLVLLHFNQLGYSPVTIAFLFLLYEFMGILTNLIGGWVGSRTGLARTLVTGLAIQVGALLALTLLRDDWSAAVSVPFVMGIQALSGVAKDLTKMSSKSAVKFVAGDGDGRLFRLVAVLTGSKNALKGVGFFIGAALLAWIGYRPALSVLAGLVAAALVAVLVLLDEDIGRASKKRTLRAALSPSTAINRLSAARFFLFGARDIWFVVALPVFLDDVLGWSFEGIGGFLAAWVIGYGMVQTVAPRLVRASGRDLGAEVGAARTWALALGVVAAAIAAAVSLDPDGGAGPVATIAIVGGLLLFGIVFALNSSLHSFLILAYSQGDAVATDVGFYYSANAAGRLVGTLLSGVLALVGGLEGALWGSTAFLAVAWLLTRRLPTTTEPVATVPAGVD
ncbi:MAG: organoarsenical effux MFS transporter ArsJ [Actinomycetota bacterium]